jgi:hypothetical protein
LSLLEGFCANNGDLCGSGLAVKLFWDWADLAAQTVGVMGAGGFGEAGDQALDGDAGAPDRAYFEEFTAEEDLAAEDAGDAGGGLTRVGRWMSSAEHEAMTDWHGARRRWRDDVRCTSG